MGNISLREYNQEIELLIDQGQLDEAIAHCKHILKYFPKHIDSYRLLGKAFLEAQRYSEAADILQRVLSVLPDDFISHLGMSIIKEDEGNLDAAIWHIERAFEIQPSNVAIQEELRRLYGRRDGVQPPKVRLTRGALIRMYSKGDLLSQAIAEARSAINEDPQRLDLEVLLAKMYFQAGQNIEATQLCSQLIGKLPYCFEANRILTEILAETNRKGEVATYQRRVNSIDPYYLHKTPETTDINQVPAEAVTLDKLNWDPSQQEANIPEWAQTIGVEIKPSKTPSVPEWMVDLPSGPVEINENQLDSFSASPQLSSDLSEDDEAIEGEENTGDAIPEWMLSAGWTPSSGGAQMDDHIFGDNAAAEDEPIDAIPANLPEWLKEIEPADPEGISSPTLNDSEETELFPESTENIGTPIENLSPSEPNPCATEADASFAWLESLAARQGADEETLLLPPEERQEKPPDWVNLVDTEPVVEPLSTFSPETLETHEAEQDGFQDWLIRLESENLQKNNISSVSEEESDAVPEWLKEIESTSDKSEFVFESDDNPDAIQPVNFEEWLNNIDNPVETQAETPSNIIETPLPDFEAPSIEEKINNISETLPEENISTETTIRNEDIASPPLEPLEIPKETAPKDDEVSSGEMEFLQEFSQLSASAKMNLETQGLLLENAQASLSSKDNLQALNLYSQLIDAGLELENVISDLKSALYQSPLDVNMWQTLGDAYLKSNLLQEALNAYTKAEELLRD